MPRSETSVTHIALLRGLNVGGKNKLPMKDLAALFSAAGASKVQTYIQSGNVVFQAADGAAMVGARVSQAILKQAGLRIPIVVRSSAELREALQHNPFLERWNPDALHLVFLADRPKPAAVAGLDPKRSPTDSFAVRGREVYLHCPGGYGNTKLTCAFFDAKLATVSTCRNWRTSQKLLELATAA